MKTWKLVAINAAVIAAMLLGAFVHTARVSAHQEASSNTVPVQSATVGYIRTPYGILNCGIVTCSFYFTRRVTTKIARIPGFVIGALAAIPRAGPFLGAYAGFALWKAKMAAEVHQCLRVRFMVSGSGPYGFYVDRSRYCWNG